MKNNPCPYCEKDAAIYQETHHTNLYIEKFGPLHILKTEVNACPPFVECSRRGEEICAAFIINFCPHCGRDLRPRERGTP